MLGMHRPQNTADCPAQRQRPIQSRQDITDRLFGKAQQPLGADESRRLMGCMAMAAERDGDEGGTTYGNAGDSNGSESDKEGDSEDLDNASLVIARTMEDAQGGGNRWEDDSRLSGN